MRIEMKLTADELQYLDRQFENSTKLNAAQFNALKLDRKVVISILINVGDKLAKKYRTLSRKPSLFDMKKKHKITFDFYEGYAIHIYLAGAINLETDLYRKNMARKIHAMIDPYIS